MNPRATAGALRTSQAREKHYATNTWKTAYIAELERKLKHRLTPEEAFELATSKARWMRGWGYL